MAKAARPDPRGLEGEIRELASFDAGDLVVVSLALDTDGRRFPRRSDLELQVGDLVRRARADAPALGLSRAAARSLDADLDRIARFVADEFDRGDTRGLAIFACAGARLWRVVELPRSLRSRVVLDRHPHVLQLEALLSTGGTTLTALVDRAKARVFLTRLGATTERTDVFDEVPGRHDQGGWSQARFARHIEDHVHRHLRHAADVLFALSKREPVERLVLAGPDPVVAEFEKALHPWLAERVAGRVNVPMNAGVARVRQATLEVEDRLEEDRVREVVGRLREEAEAGRLAVLGLEPTIEAVRQGRAETLVVGDGRLRPGWRCPACGSISARDGTCSSCGAALVAVPDLIEEVVDLALGRGCHIVTAAPDKLPAEVGALLRF